MKTPSNVPNGMKSSETPAIALQNVRWRRRHRNRAAAVISTPYMKRAKPADQYRIAKATRPASPALEKSVPTLLSVKRTKASKEIPATTKCNTEAT